MATGTGKVRAALLDADGVLVDSAAAHRRVWTMWANGHGLELETLWPHTFGRRARDTVAAVAPWLDADGEVIALERLVERFDDGAPAMPGAAELLAVLTGLPWAVVTSATREVTGRRVKRLGWSGARAVICAEDVQHGKPHPECYLRAASALGMPSQQCVAVEDAPAGIAAAREAGCYVVAVATTHDRAALQAAHECCADLAGVASRVAALLRSESLGR